MAQYIARRSDADILAMTPLKLKLGKQEYSVDILPNRKAQQWREKLYDALSPIVSTFDLSGIDLNADHQMVSRIMTSKLSQQLLKFPEKLLELIFAYGPNLPADEIRDAASDEQIALAFAQVSEVGYPFFFHLYATQKSLSAPPQTPPPQPMPARTM